VAGHPRRDRVVRRAVTFTAVARHISARRDTSGDSEAVATASGDASDGAFDRAAMTLSRSGFRTCRIHAPCRSHVAPQTRQQTSIDMPDSCSTSTGVAS
jgi:hypothetical protein